MNADDKISHHIARLNTQNNYWGWLFSVIRRREAIIPSIMAITSDEYGKLELLYDKDLVLNTDDNNLYYIIKHEGIHVLKNHISRLLKLMSEQSDISKSKINNLFDIASDIVVNRDAKIPKKLIIDGKELETSNSKLYKLPDNLTTEGYFWKLFDKDNEESNNKKSSNNDEKSESNDGDNEKSENNDDSLSNSNQNIDDHGQWLNKNSLEKISDIDNLARRIDYETKKLVSKSVKAFEKIKGNHIPNEIQELIDELLEPPKVPYYQIIQKLVKGTKVAKRISSSNRLNRKRLTLFGTNILPYPGKINDYSFKIVIILDTSGSMKKDDIIEGLSSCRNIIENDRHCEVTVIEIDTIIRNEYNIKKINDIQMSFKGRGGTRLAKGLMRAKLLRPDCTLIFTDGYCENINEMRKKELPSKIIWVVQKDENKGTINMINRFPHIVRV